ncbi:hypothetical protein RCH23_002139 [Cryobacterium sp. CAN_C3]|nr:hypothetical protein [Cryobacterium sp. CAN_C3]MEC5154754.1 hypothetical protein [Cryobacterium sp. CAN_C3]
MTIDQFRADMLTSAQEDKVLAYLGDTLDRGIDLSQVTLPVHRRRKERGR